MVRIIREPFNYDDESWVVSSRGYIPPAKKRTADSSEARPKPPERPPKPEPQEKE